MAHLNHYDNTLSSGYNYVFYKGYSSNAYRTVER